MARALDFGPSGYLYATHSLHAFAARCPPPLVRWALSRYSGPGDVVLDPMVGSGTTLVEAALLGRRGRGVDIDPLARLIAKVKSTPVPLDAWKHTVDRVATLLAEPASEVVWRPALPDLDRWFRPDVAADLARLRVLVLRDHWEPDVRDLLWTAFSSLIVARTSVVNARDLVHSRHHYRPWDRNPDVPGRFLGHLRRVARLLADYHARLETAGNREPDVRVIGADARRLPLPDASVDLVFTSPPYCSALDYTRAHQFAVAWMPEPLGVGLGEYRTLARAYVGSERAPPAEASPLRPLPPRLGTPTVDAAVAALTPDPRRAWIVHRYFRDMTAVLREAARVVRPGKRVPRPNQAEDERRIAELNEFDEGYPQLTLSRVLDLVNMMRAHAGKTNLEDVPIYNPELGTPEARKALIRLVQHTNPSHFPSWQKTRSRLWRLHQFGIFDHPQHPNLSMGDVLGRGQVSIIDLSDTDSPQLNNIVIADLLRRVQRVKDAGYKQWERNDFDGAPTKVLIIIEEAHEFLSSDRIAKMPVLFEQVTRIARRGRKRWLGLVFVTQLPQHLPREVLGLVNNFVLHKINDETVLRSLQQVIPGVDQGLWRRMPALAPGQAVVSLTHMTRPLLVTIDPAGCRLRMVD